MKSLEQLTKEFKLKPVDFVPLVGTITYLNRTCSALESLKPVDRISANKMDGKQLLYSLGLGLYGLAAFYALSFNIIDYAFSH